MGQYVTVTVEEKIAVVTLNNPPVNALCTPLMKDLETAIDAAGSNPDVKVVLLTAAGMFFVAGADIKEIASIESKEKAMELVLQGQNILNKMENLSKPVIAVINGMCLGGGNELAMAAHMRIAGESAKFGQPEINLGIIPGFGGTQRLARYVGMAKALELDLTGDMISAAEAKAIGLVNKVVPDAELLKQAKGLAKKIASKGGKANAAILTAMREGLRGTLGDGLKREAELFAEIAMTEDKKEGVKAFLEKRQPKFMDK